MQPTTRTDELEVKQWKTRRKGDISIWDPTIIRRAIPDSFKKLDPRVQVKNPVMFVVEIGSVITTIEFVRLLFAQPTSGFTSDQLVAERLFVLAVAIWLWFTVIFANFAEAMAEGRGKAQADTLRRARTTTMAKKLSSADRHGTVQEVAAPDLHKGDLVLVEAGDVIPGDGDVVEGVASVDESAITGESAPVIRESGGDRLAFSVGIIFLSVLSSALLVVFGGNTNALINLFAVGVFMSFTLSQAGMVLHWWRLRHEHKGWQRSMTINGVGAATTLLVAVVISTTKFLEGAWIVVLLIPVLVLMFMGIHRHYQRVARERTTDIPMHPKDIHHRFVVPIAGLDRAAIQSLAYARSLSPHVTAIHVAVDADEAKRVRAAWDEWQKHLAEDEETHLLVIESPYRSLARPLLAYIDTINQHHPDEILTVILPEFVVAHWWEYLLHNQTAFRLKAALLFRPGIVVCDVPQHLRDRPGK